MPVQLSDAETRRLLLDLEPEVAVELDRQGIVAHDAPGRRYVPWSDGRTFDGVLNGEAWTPEDSKIPDVARTSLIVNLLTEDNLPSYHFEIARAFGRDGAWGTWVHRWTAEEDRHGAVLRDYLTVTRAVDPVALEQARMVHMSTGFRNAHDSMLHSLAYVSFQELATRISHRNTGAASKDPICEQMMTRIATDENLHMIFYRNLMAAAFEASPDAAMCAVRDEVVGFAMPGDGMPGFLRNSVVIAKAGIYDLRLHHDEVVAPVLKFWGTFERADVGPVGEQAREELATFVAGLDTRATRFVEQRDRSRAKAGVSA